MKSLTIIGLIVITVGSLWLRGQNLSAPFYYDEAVYVDLAQHPFHSNFYDDKIFYRHPPAHYLLLAALGKVAGFSEAVMRWPSLLFSAATALLLYFMGLRLFSRSLGFIAALLWIGNVLNQQYAEAATMYAMFAFLLTLCGYGFVREKEWLVAAGFVGAIYTHYFGFFLAPALLLFYYRKFGGEWKKIAGRAALYALAYAPWLVIAAQGLVFHANRTSGLRWWSFHWQHALRQMSLALFFGALRFSWLERHNLKLQPVLLTCGFYLLAAFFLLPFHRYLVPFLPILILFGAAGLAQGFAFVQTKLALQHPFWKAALPLASAGLLFIPNPQAYGVFPQHGQYLDLRDSIHTQEWERVIAAIPEGARVATPNARSLLYYSNLRGLRNYHVEQFNENQKEFHALLQQATNDWIVLSKFPPYTALHEIANAAVNYAPVAEFEHTVLYRRKEQFVE